MLTEIAFDRTPGSITFNGSAESFQAWLNWLRSSTYSITTNGWCDYSDQTTASTWSTWSNWNSGTTGTTSCADAYWPFWWQQQLERGPAIITSPSKSELEKAKRDAKQRRELIRAADDRAEQLLIAHLNKRQRESFRRNGCFRVIGQDGQQYEIDARKRQHNVYRLREDGKRAEEFCIYLRQPYEPQLNRQHLPLPLADNALGQLLMLQSEIEEFKRRANHMALIRAS